MEKRRGKETRKFMTGNETWRKEEEKRLGSIWKGMKPGEKKMKRNTNLKNKRKRRKENVEKKLKL